LLIITPGPGVLSLAGVGAAYGFRAGLRYFTGLFIGTNLVALAVVTGLAALILASTAIRTVLMIASTAYLLYLAYKIATAGSRIGFKAASRQPGIRDGVALQLIKLWVGARLKAMNLAPGTQRVINVFMACAMLAVVALALWSSASR